MSTQTTNNGRKIQFVIIVFLSVILIIGNDTINSFISDQALRIFYYPFFKIKNSVVDLGSVADENLMLRKKLVETSKKITEMEEAVRENSRLRSILGFEPPLGYSLMPAKVVSIIGDKTTGAVINRGLKDSVFIDQTLINRDGLIGRIVEVSDDFATVQLLTDPYNRVAARVAVSREMGIVKYVPSKGMILDNFPIEGSIAIGDEILSSGLGQVYQAGILVGKVLSIERKENEPFCRVQIEPAVNFNSIEELFLLRPIEP